MYENFQKATLSEADVHELLDLTLILPCLIDPEPSKYQLLHAVPSWHHSYHLTPSTYLSSRVNQIS